MRDRDLAALRDFDSLPEGAHVRLPVVMALYSISRATVWRWCKSGALPAPIHISGVTFWKVGELRERIRAERDRVAQLARQGGCGDTTADDLTR